MLQSFLILYHTCNTIFGQLIYYTFLNFLIILNSIKLLCTQISYVSIILSSLLSILKYINISYLKKEATNHFQLITKPIIICSTTQILLCINNIFKYHTNMTQEIDIMVLKKQNTELAAKIEYYRKQNKQLKSKNQELDTWVVNFSTILCSLQAAMRVFIQNQESLYALMKKSDIKQKSWLNKYTQHFKTFNDILSNLAQKIKNTQRSDQSTQQTKVRIDSFVKMYQLFFKEFVDQYFKYNDDNLRWVNDVLSKPDLQEIFRKIGYKEMQHRNKIKEFQTYMEDYRGRYPLYVNQNQNSLMGQILKKKQEYIRQLEQQNENMSRKFKLIMDYNKLQVENVINQKQEYYTCFCGGNQIEYFKKAWQQIAKKQLAVTKIQNYQNPQLNNQKIQMLNNQIQYLLQNNSSYLQKIQKIKIQKNIEQAIFKSHAYNQLLGQCQELMKFCLSLQEKLRVSHERVLEIQRQRDRELKQLKKKYDYERIQTNPIVVSNLNFKINKKDLMTFKNDMQSIYKPLFEILKQSGIHEKLKFDNQSKIKENIEFIKKQNQDLVKRINELTKQPKYLSEIDFKHQSHKKLIKDVENFIPKDEVKILERFLDYTKSRQKKLQHLERQLKKKEKELAGKTQMCEILKQNLTQTQKLFKDISKKNELLTKSLELTKDELNKISEENFEIKTEYDNEKSLLNLKLKSEIQNNSKLQEKIKLIQTMKEDAQTAKNLYLQYITEQSSYLQQIKQRAEINEIQQKNFEQEYSIMKTKFIEYQKTQKRYIQDNQRLRTKLNAIKKTQFKKQQLNTQQRDLEIMEIELQNFKNKFYCSCRNDRQIQVSLKSCPHVFCKKCIDDCQNSRNRACPLCKQKFSKSDINQIKWN